MYSMVRTPAIIMCGFLLLLSALSVSAQDSDSYALYVEKEYPSPGETVAVGVEAGFEPLSRLQSVIWRVDGVVVADETDSLEIDYLTDNDPSFISAEIAYFDFNGNRRTTQASLWVTPVIFDVLWEGLGVTTPLYRGYRLAHLGTPIRLTAVVRYVDTRGNVFTEDDFFFRWSNNAHRIGGGPKKNSIVLEDPRPPIGGRVQIDAGIHLLENSDVEIEKSIAIPLVGPRVLLYEHDLSRGLNTRRVVADGDRVARQPFTASVYPFYFSQGDFEKNSIQYRWFINNHSEPASEARRVSLSYEGESTPISLSVQIQNNNEEVQQTNKRLILRF